jgi:hypothetical protein
MPHWTSAITRCIWWTTDLGRYVTYPHHHFHLMFLFAAPAHELRSLFIDHARNKTAMGGSAVDDEPRYHAEDRSAPRPGVDAEPKDDVRVVGGDALQSKLVNSHHLNRPNL